MPYGSEKQYETATTNFYRYEMNFSRFINSLEDEMQRHRLIDQGDKRERAILISVSTRPKYEMEDSMEELKKLGLFKRCKCA